ncbi:MAG: GlsB/YeaQ/YmgE family stress response membrane protein [Solirubrobacterales bacterium]
MLGLILYLVVIGIVAGYLARLLVPGKDSLGFLGTVALGIVGSFIGGFLGYVLFDKDFGEGALQASGLIGSIIGAILALLAWRAIGDRGATRRPLAR